MEKVFVVQNNYASDLSKVNEFLERRKGKVKMIVTAGAGDNNTYDIYAYIVVEFE